MTKKTLLGIKRFSAKDGKKYATLQIEMSFNDRELNSGCVGSKVEEIFIPDELFYKIDSLVVGKNIDLIYDVQGNRAYLVDFVTVK